MDKQNSNGHFQIQWTLSFGYLNGTVSTSFKYMAIDQLKKQMSDGNSTCPLDPMDTPKSNGQLETHLTNGMSNGLLIFPSDILHRYWTLIKITSQSDYKNSDFSAGENSPGGNNHNICRATKEITVSPKFGDRQILCARFFLQLRMSFV